MVAVARPFRLRSWLGASVVLFLLYGLVNVLAATFVPLSLHFRGAGAIGALVLSPQADEAFLARSLEALGRSDPRLGSYLVLFMDTMCAQMMAFAIFQLAVVWFALRRGQRWALWATVTADLAIVPYNVAIFATYASAGVPLTIDAVGFTVFLAALVLAPAFLGWLALRRAPA